jgi:alkanesulfonate monooxygenase SsuD/methylene tetrahydromethanopterin reductase-like flavin-dependent oxidoreductase (luciferase family)
MRVGLVILPEHRWWVAEPKWRAAEQYGFDHAWTYDHLGWHSLVDNPWFAAMPTLTAAAMVTERIRLGTFVASPNYRHPVSFARELISLDDLSDGRFTLGLGAGGVGYDSTVFGGRELPQADRSARFAEFVHLTDLLLRYRQTSYRGEYYTAVQARSWPGCAQQPRMPFLIAANGPRSMRVAAKYGQGWVTTGHHASDLDEWWSSVADLVKKFDGTLRAAGRDPAGISRYLSLDAAPVFSLSSVQTFADAAQRARDLGFTDVVAHWPRPEGIYAGHESVLEDIAEKLLPDLQAD